MSGRSPPSPASQADALVGEIASRSPRAPQALDDAEREADAIRGAPATRRAGRCAARSRRCANPTPQARAGARRAWRPRCATTTRCRSSAGDRVAAPARGPRAGWDDDAAAATWMRAQLADTRARLGPRGWLVRHPASAMRPGSRRCATRSSQGAIEPSLRANSGLDAGLVVEVGGGAPRRHAGRCSPSGLPWRRRCSPRSRVAAGRDAADE
jgi:hypothetical protein